VAVRRALEEVADFWQVCSWIYSTGKEVFPYQCIVLAWQAANRLGQVRKTKQRRSLKLSVFCATVDLVSILLYGHDTWKLTK